MKGQAFIDGGARGNPGPGAAGAVVDGPKPLALKKYLGEVTNNVAEYNGLIMVLAESLKVGYTELDIFADSELLVKQIRGEYKVKNPGLRALYLEAQKYLQQLKKYTITHVRREFNSAADALVNQAIDEALHV